jgi:hypothetical protein
MSEEFDVSLSKLERTELWLVSTPAALAVDSPDRHAETLSCEVD